MEVPPTFRHPANKQGREGRLKNLTGGVRGEMEERWGGEEFLGPKSKVLISTRLAEEGNWSQFLGGAFVQGGDIPLMMAGRKIQPESES